MGEFREGCGPIDRDWLFIVGLVFLALAAMAAFVVAA